MIGNIRSSLLYLAVIIYNVHHCHIYFGDDFSCPNSVPKPWTPEWLNGNDLVCRCAVKDSGPNEKQRDDYCTCLAFPKWRGQEKALEVEYISVMGKTLVVPYSNFNYTIVYKIHHSSEEMTELPSNLCNWDTDSTITDTYEKIFEGFKTFWKHIVHIDFSWSNIKSLRDINCLERLFSLDLSRNRLTHIPNTSFHKLTHLRNVDFSSNYIVTIDPAVTSGDNLKLLIVDFSENNLTLIDVSNMFSKHPFCHFNYKNNEITEMVNELHVKLDISFGSGYVDLENNLIKTFPDLKELLNLDDLSEIGKILSFGFDLRGIPLVCDCNLQPFRGLGSDIIESIWRNYLNVTCTGPERHAGKSALNIPPDDLICTVEANENTTIGCVYKDVPEYKTLFVNCSDAGLHKLPESMPRSKFSEYIDLDISYNYLTHIDNATYLNKLSRLNISHNRLLTLDHDTAVLLENATYIDLSNNPDLREIPQIFQYRNSCSLSSENNTILCDCDTRWIISWLKNRQCGNENLFHCEVDGHSTIVATHFQDTMLRCETENTIIIKLMISLSVVMALLILITSLVYHFKYELLVSYLRFRRIKKASILPQLKYDVYIVHDEENEACRKWVTVTLLPELEKEGYYIYLPIRNMGVCDVRSNAIIETLNESSRFLFVLSDSYLDKDGGDDEWKYAWGLMKRDRMKKIVIVNYDFISSFDVLHPQIKAYLRVGSTVTFDNWDRDIIPRIILQLGPPRWPREEMDADLIKKVACPNMDDLFAIEFKIDRCDEVKKEVYAHDEVNQQTDRKNEIELGNAIVVTEKKRPVGGPFQYYMYDRNSKLVLDVAQFKS